MAKMVSGPLSEGTAAFPWPPPDRGEADELVWAGLVYSCPPGYRPLFLDLHVPRHEPAGDRPPLVLWVHGGGWVSGSRRRLPPGIEEHWLIERAILAGFAVALVDYRLASEAPFPAAVADLRAAVRWLRAHAGDFGLDPARVALWGESAGAHIACLAATCTRDLGAAPGGQSENLDQPEDPQAIVDWYGPSDIAAMKSSGAPASAATEVPGGSADPAGVLLAGSDWDEAAASPLSYVRPGLPPFLVAQGRGDDVVPVAQARAYSTALSKAGVDVEYAETDGGHVFAGAPVMDEMIDRALGFLGRHLDVPRPALDPAIGDIQSRTRQTGQFPLFITDDPVEVRRRAEQDQATFYPRRPYPVASDMTRIIRGPGGDISLRILVPAVPSDVVLVYLHGGGWVIGNLESHWGLGVRLASSVPATVVMASYRLAPENPFPAGFDDAVAAVGWAAGHLGDVGGKRLVLAGDSAGGNLAAGAALHCRDQGIDLAGQLLLYPVTDWARHSFGGLVGSYLAGHQDAAGDPRVSPALGDLAGLPPTIIGVGGLDLLLADNLAYAYRLRQAGVPVTVGVFPTLGHGFFGYAGVSDAADRAAERMCRELRQLMLDPRS